MVVVSSLLPTWSSPVTLLMSMLLLVLLRNANISRVLMTKSGGETSDGFP
jgi:hypothetical protein